MMENTFHNDQGQVHVNTCYNLQLQVGRVPDQLPSERQVRVDDPTNLHPLLQVQVALGPPPTVVTETRPRLGELRQLHPVCIVVNGKVKYKFIETKMKINKVIYNHISILMNSKFNCNGTGGIY